MNGFLIYGVTVVIAWFIFMVIMARFPEWRMSYDNDNENVRWALFFGLVWPSVIIAAIVVPIILGVLQAGSKLFNVLKPKDERRGN